jgi:hypothetical protein
VVKQFTLNPGFPRSRVLNAEYTLVRCMRQASDGLCRPSRPSERAISGLRLAFLGAFERFSVNYGRSPPTGLSAFIAPDPHAGSGGGFGRSSSIRRRMLANSDRGTATSASWNTT